MQVERVWEVPVTDPWQVDPVLPLEPSRGSRASDVKGMNSFWGWMVAGIAIVVLLILLVSGMNST
jgi:hypothetical protein